MLLCNALFNRKLRYPKITPKTVKDQNDFDSLFMLSYHIIESINKIPPIRYIAKVGIIKFGRIK